MKDCWGVIPVKFAFSLHSENCYENTVDMFAINMCYNV